ncbi:hypothetical protein U8335_19100 [Roseiconus lacunae]|uniref:hypothetical protein n=1 Tax=Roseiconus lacunae TaxID=2605694 RepID=UPI0030896275|nr:hypothetical protein U8335_19100 [Stieleria sp. HD01]
MPWVLEFTEAELERPPSEPEKVAATVREMFDGETPVRTMDVAERKSWISQDQEKAKATPFCQEASRYTSQVEGHERILADL